MWTRISYGKNVNVGNIHAAPWKDKYHNYLSREEDKQALRTMKEKIQCSIQYKNFSGWQMAEHKL